MLTCRVNGKRYIGKSNNIKRRLNEHRLGKSYSPVICKAIAKYGWDAFDKTVLEFCPVEELGEKEIYYIAKFQPEYNLSKGGGGHRGYTSLSAIKKLQKSIICIDTGEIFDSVNSAAAKVGVTHSCVSMALNSKTKTAGGYSWEYLNPADKISKETSERKGRANRGRKQSAEQIEKRVSHFKGKRSENYNSYKKVFCVETGRIFASVKIAAESVGITPCFLSKVLHGIKKTAGGYHWKFAKEVFL